MNSEPKYRFNCSVSNTVSQICFHHQSCGRIVGCLVVDCVPCGSSGGAAPAKQLSSGHIVSLRSGEDSKCFHFTHCVKSGFIPLQLTMAWGS